MQALTITIPGKFWDSQIYSGRLYLFDREGAIRTIDWDRLVDEWPVPSELRLPMSCAFRRSDYLYGSHWDLVFADSEIKRLLIDKFERLSRVDLTLDAQRMSSLFLGEQDTPFPFPHTDSRIYARRMYVGSHQGIYSASAGRHTKHPVSTRVQQRWDGPTEALAVYSMTMAIAAGEEGLFETRIGDTYWQYQDEEDSFEDDVRQVARRRSDDCQWAYGSIYASAHGDSSYLAAFRVADMEEDEQRQADAHEEDYFAEPMRQHDVQPPKVRRFERYVDATQIFGDAGYSWANRDKICQARNGMLHIVRYRPWADQSDQLQHLSDISVSAWKGEVIGGDVAVFGVVAECENALIVIPSDGTPITLQGEPVRWRVFPRSRHYENQLHVIYEDRLEVWSFNHDYFVDQETKTIGISAW